MGRWLGGCWGSQRIAWPQSLRWRWREVERASLVAQMVKNLPTMLETLVRSQGQEDPLEKEMVMTPVFLPGESHGQVGYSPRGHKEH